MRIEIAQRLHPFSHQAGTSVILPGSPFRLEVFPTKIIVSDLSLVTPVFCVEVSFDLKGPMSNFTVIQDLEKGEIVVLGNAIQGYFRYKISALVDAPGIAVTLDKLPSDIKVTTSGWSAIPNEDWKEGSTHFFGIIPQEAALFRPARVERLSLGSHKAQEWSQMCRSKDFVAILPIWHRLGQMVGHYAEHSIFDHCIDAIVKKNRLHVLNRFREVFLFAFDTYLSPRLHDPLFQGIGLPEISGSPLPVLSQGSALIRSLFVQITESHISLLAATPPDFHAGRMLDIMCNDWGTLSFEWTKKAVRRVILSAHRDQTISLTAAVDQRACRVRTSTKDRGISYNIGSELTLHAGTTYWFDNFQR